MNAALRDSCFKREGNGSVVLGTDPPVGDDARCLTGCDGEEVVKEEVETEGRSKKKGTRRKEEKKQWAEHSLNLYYFECSLRHLVLGQMTEAIP